MADNAVYLGCGNADWLSGVGIGCPDGCMERSGGNWADGIGQGNDWAKVCVPCVGVM